MARIRDYEIGMDSFDRGRETEIPSFYFMENVNAQATSCSNWCDSSINTLNCTIASDVSAIDTVNKLNVNGTTYDIGVSSTVNNRLEELEQDIRKIQSYLKMDLRKPKNDFKIGGIVRLTRAALKTL